MNFVVLTEKNKPGNGKWALDNFIKYRAVDWTEPRYRFLVDSIDSTKRMHQH